jgi:hypothetical protein
MPASHQLDRRYKLSVKQAREMVRRNKPARIKNEPYACAAIALVAILRHSTIAQLLVEQLSFPHTDEQSLFFRCVTQSLLDSGVARELFELGQCESLMW